MAAAFAAGLALADEVQPSGPTAAAVGFAGVCCLVSAWTRHRKLPDARDGELLPRIAKATAVLLMVGWAAVGFANLGVRAAALAGSYLPELHGRVVVVEGVVGSDPARMGRAWSYSLRKVRTVPQSAAAPGSGERAQSGRLLVRTFGKPPQVALGDRVRTELKISRLDSREPFDAWLARRGIAATGVALSRVERLTSTSNPLLAASNLFRRRMSAASGAAMDQTRASLLMGVVIGDETRIGQDVEQDFRASGLSHLTAVSGANVAMVLAALALLLGAMRIPRRPAVVIGLAVIVLFTLVTRWEPSVLRAAVMASAGLAAFLFGRVPTPGHAFVLAFLGLVAFDPMVLWSAGFQLSFAATAGILWLRPVLAARLKIVPKPLAEAVAIGIAAQVAVFPLIALHFGRISAAAVPATWPPLPS